MPQSTLEQFIRFGTDAAAIERMLRMVQAIVMVVISQPFLTNGFVELIALGNQHVWEEPRVANVSVLANLRGQLNLARRFFRIFRFLESFRAANTLYASFYSQPPPAPPAEGAGPGAQAQQQKQKQKQQQPPAEAWLDIFGRTFNGMFLLLETLNLVDAMQVPGLALWGRHWSAVLHVEGQRFWFFALACGVASGLTKLVKLFAYAPVPPPAPTPVVAKGEGEGEDEGAAPMADWEKERERMRGLVWRNKEQRRMWKENIRSKSRGLVRGSVANFLDLAVPGSVVGWVPVESGTVGAVMVVTTYLTGMDIWERCGRDVAKS